MHPEMARVMAEMRIEERRRVAAAYRLARRAACARRAARRWKAKRPGWKRLAATLPWLREGDESCVEC
jgi:hypothetical protein